MPSNGRLLSQLYHLTLEKDLFEKIDDLKRFLGHKEYKVTVDEALRKRAEALCEAFRLKKEITLDGNPLDASEHDPSPLQDIANLAKCRLVQAESLKKISEIKDNEDLTAENFKYLKAVTHVDSQKSFKNFCESYFLDEKQSYVNDAFNKIKKAAEDKSKLVEQNTEKRSKDKVIALARTINTKQTELKDTSNKIKTAITNSEEIFKLIDTKQLEVSLALQDKKVELANARNTILKTALQEYIHNYEAQLKVLNITKQKLELIKDRLIHRHEKASLLISNNFKSTLDKINKVPARVEFFYWEEGYKRFNDPTPRQLYYFKDGDKLKYKIKPSDTTPVMIGEIDLKSLGLESASESDLRDSKNQTKILEVLYARKHVIDDRYVSYKLGQPEFGIAADEKAVASTVNILEDFKDDVSRCERVINLCRKTAEEPSKQLHAKLPVNTFVEVMSIADITAFNAEGKPFFIVQIIDEKTQKPRFEKDSRTRYGLEGEVITRGIMLKPGEVKRSSYRLASSKSSIVIDTKFVKSKNSGQYSVAKSEYTVTENLTTEEKQLGALRYARELLRQYAEGDSKSKITIRAGRGKNAENAQEHASYVYAAILMLTSPENNNDDYIHLPSDKLIIDVKGVDCPKTFSWDWNKRQAFIDSYFPKNAKINKESVKEFKSKSTEEYRSLRQDINRQNKQAKIVENAPDDVYTTPLKRI